MILIEFLLDVLRNILFDAVLLVRLKITQSKKIKNQKKKATILETEERLNLLRSEIKTKRYPRIIPLSRSRWLPSACSPSYRHFSRSLFSSSLLLLMVVAAAVAVAVGSSHRMRPSPNALPSSLWNRFLSYSRPSTYFSSSLVDPVDVLLLLILYLTLVSSNLRKKVYLIRI